MRRNLKRKFPVLDGFRKIALSEFRFNSTKMDSNLAALKYYIGTERQKNIVPFKLKDTNLYAKIERCFETLVQSTIDHISKDSAIRIDESEANKIRENWQKITGQLITSSSTSSMIEPTKYEYQTPDKSL